MPLYRSVRVSWIEFLIIRITKSAILRPSCGVSPVTRSGAEASVVPADCRRVIISEIPHHSQGQG